MTPSCKRPFLESFRIWLSHANEGFWIYRILIWRKLRKRNEFGHICRLTIVKSPVRSKSGSGGLPSGIPSTHETSESSHRNIRMIFHFTLVDDGRARGKDWTRFPVFNLLLSHWSSQLFDLRVSSSTDVLVLLLNQLNIFLKPLSGVV